jgi:2'-5' RNA ligase
VRLFVACELPGELAASLAVWAARATGRDPALRLLAIDQLHLTLAFLGAMSPAQVDDVEDAMREALRDEPWPSVLRVGEPVWLAPRAPHVLAVEVADEDGALGGLQERLVGGLVDSVGFARERRRFLPHVTVARVRRGQTPRDYSLDPAPAPVGFGAEAVTLMRSHLGPGGARYEPLVRLEPS